MKYFDNGRDRAVFRSMASRSLEWYDRKVIAYAQLAFTAPMEFNEVQYFDYVSRQQLLSNYLVALDSEDIQEGAKSVVPDVGSSPVVVGASSEASLDMLTVACMWRHADFAGMSQADQDRLIADAREWYRIFGDMKP